jgi:hypothetical protein
VFYIKVNAKLPRTQLIQRYLMKAYGMSGCIDPRILELGTR